MRPCPEIKQKYIVIILDNSKFFMIEGCSQCLLMLFWKWGDLISLRLRLKKVIIWDSALRKTREEFFGHMCNDVLKLNQYNCWKFCMNDSIFTIEFTINSESKIITLCG